MGSGSSRRSKRAWNAGRADGPQLRVANRPRSGGGGGLPGNGFLVPFCAKRKSRTGVLENGWRDEPLPGSGDAFLASRKVAVREARWDQAEYGSGFNEFQSERA